MISNKYMIRGDPRAVSRCIGSLAELVIRCLKLAYIQQRLEGTQAILTRWMTWVRMYSHLEWKQSHRLPWLPTSRILDLLAQSNFREPRFVILKGYTVNHALRAHREISPVAVFELETTTYAEAIPPHYE